MRIEVGIKPATTNQQSANIAVNNNRKDMTLGQIAEVCYNITASFLRLGLHANQITKQTQNVVRLTRGYFLKDIFPKWDPLNHEISFAYNGGKDCQVLLLLYLSSLWEHYMIGANQSQYGTQYHRFPLDKLPTVFINSSDTFSELDSFITMTTERYHLSLYESTDVPVNNTMKKAKESKYTGMAQEFDTYLDVHPETKAIVIGVRHSDPYGETLKTIQMTDSNWPQFIRLQPLLEWNLANVWSFLLYSGEPICPLYRYGYTSLGGVNNTLPNPFLKRDSISSSNDVMQFQFQTELDNSPSEIPWEDRWHSNDSKLVALGERYLPGWHLLEDAKERAGRIVNKR